jgi:hypothetical protein
MKTENNEKRGDINSPLLYYIENGKYVFTEEYNINIWYNILKYDVNVCILTTMSIFINMGKSIDITNKQFGNLLALKYSYTNKVEHWEYKCLLCGNITTCRKPDVTRGKIKSCGCKKNVGINNGNWSGYENLNGRTLGHYKKSAKLRNLEFNLTLKDMWDTYIQQEKLCPYTGVQLILEPMDKNKRTPNNASLDRIDSNKGYIVGNIQWVLKKINVMKNVMSHDEFIDVCLLVSKNYKKNKIIDI